MYMCTGVRVCVAKATSTRSLFVSSWLLLLFSYWSFNVSCFHFCPNKNTYIKVMCVPLLKDSLNAKLLFKNCVPGHMVQLVEASFGAWKHCQFDSVRAHAWMSGLWVRSLVGVHGVREPSVFLFFFLPSPLPSSVSKNQWKHVLG